MNYKTIIEDIKDRIWTRTYEEGEKLPPDRVLAEQYGVSIKTLKFAFRELERQNLLVRVNGKGSFIGRTVRDPVVLLMIPSAPMRDHLMALVFQLERILSSNGITLHIMTTGHSVTRALNGLQVVDFGMVGAVVVYNSEPESHVADLCRQLRKRGNRIVLLENSIPNEEGYYCILNEEESAAAELGRLLQEHRYDRYCFIVRSDSAAGEARIRGFLSAFDKPDGCRVIRIEDDEKYSVFKQDLIADLRQGIRCGIGTATDALGCDLYYSLLAAEIAVPEQAGVTGFGDVASLPVAELTTARIDFEAIGQEILGFMSRSKPCEKRIPVHIIRRRSA